MAAGTACFFFDLYLFDSHGSVDGLAHVVDREAGYADRGEGFHLDARFCQNFDRGFDSDSIFCLRLEIESYGFECQRMTERNQVGGPFGGHDAGQAGDFQYIAFGMASLENHFASGRQHTDEATGPGGSPGDGFFADVHHAAGPVFVEMAKIVHGLRVKFSRVSG